MSQGGGNHANLAPRCQSWHSRVSWGAGRQAGGGSLGMQPPLPIWLLAPDYMTCSWMGLVEKPQRKRRDSCREGAKLHPAPPSRGSCRRRGLAASGWGHQGSLGTGASIATRPPLLKAGLRAPRPSCSQLQPFPQEFADGFVLGRNLLWKSLEKPEPGCFPAQVLPGTRDGRDLPAAPPLSPRWTPGMQLGPLRATRPWGGLTGPWLCQAAPNSRKWRGAAAGLRGNEGDLVYYQNETPVAPGSVPAAPAAPASPSDICFCRDITHIPVPASPDAAHQPPLT